MTRLRATLRTLRDTNDLSWSFDDFVLYLRTYKRRAPATIQKRVTQLKFMERHPQMPVPLNGSREDIVNGFCLYVTYREQVEGVGPSGLVNDHKAIRALGGFLGIPRDVWPTAPTRPTSEFMEIPSPEQVHELLHTDWTPNAKRNYVNALIRYLLVFDFGFGVRFPSEAFVMRVQDVNLERHTLVVTEPKKSGRRRILLIEPEWLCCSKRHPSLENWFRWRDKVQPETDALFPTETGEAFRSKDALRKRLADYVKPKFPWFNPYLGRHWSVNARLIDWGYDYPRVANWHGHESVDMTKNTYEHNARLNHRLHGGDWLQRAFQKPRHTGQRPKKR